MIHIERYTPARKEAWNNHIASSKNGTFILHRDYMDYHSDRFADFSLMAFDDNRLLAVLPANFSQKQLFSHDGLTYGGLILSSESPLASVAETFYHLLKYLAENSIQEVTYKPVPAYLQSEIANEDFFILGLLNARLIRVDTSFVVDYSKPFDFQQRRIRSVKKAEKAGVTVRQSLSLREFWEQVLVQNLKSKYNAEPVHTLEEITLLHSRFPGNILQFDALLDGEVVAGVTVFVCGKTAHAQYISSVDKGREAGALDYLFHYLINETFKDKSYFSFGTANNSGNDLNKGVAEWKAGWGAKVFPHFHFRFNVGDFERQFKDLTNKV